MPIACGQQVAQHMLRCCELLTRKQLRAGKDEGGAVALWEHGAGIDFLFDRLCEC